MAKIPTGDFGNMVARGSSAGRLVPGAFDTSSGAVEAGQTAMRIAGHALGVERQEQMQIARERDQLVQEAMRKADQEEAALKKARAGNILLDYEMQVDATRNSVEEQVANGTLKYSDAVGVYDKAIGKIGLPDMTGYDPVDTENLTKGIRRLGFRGQQSIYKVSEKGRVGELQAQTDSLLDKLSKKAGLPGADMSMISQQSDSMDELGKQAYGDRWGKKKQDWIDNTWDAHLNQQALSVSSNLAGINDLMKKVTTGEYAEKLDSTRRNTLVAKLDGYKTSLVQRTEAAAARVERQRERHLNEAKAEFETFQTLADKGTILSPEYINQASQKTAGTPYQQGVVAMAKQAQETGGMASQPIAVQKQALAALDADIATNGRTPEKDKRRGQLSKVFTASQADLKKDGIRAGLERGVITSIEPLDTSSPTAMVSSIAKRVQSAELVGTWAGGPVSPIDSDEASQLRNMLEIMPPKERSQAIASINQTVGTRMGGAIAQQLDKENRPLALAFATSSAKTTAGRYTSELILSGDQAIKDGTVMKDDKKITGTKALIATEVDGLFPNAQISTAVKDATYLIAASLAKDNGGEITSSIIKKATNFAIGGSIIEHNNKRLPVPAGIDEGTFNARINNVSPQELTQQAPDGQVRVGGALLPVADFAKSLPGQELAFAGQGQYVVMVQGRPVTNTAGKRILIKVQ